LAAVEDAETVHDVADALRMDYRAVRGQLRNYGLLGDLLTAQEIIAQARASEMAEAN
jgi:hypothetical protein